MNTQQAYMNTKSACINIRTAAHGRRSTATIGCERRYALLSLLIAGLCAVAPLGEAAAGSLFNGDYLPIGVAVGWTSGGGKEGSPDARDGGFTLGLEVSYARVWEETSWYGGYLDALITPSDDDVRVSFGGEFGSTIFGIDAGLLMRVGVASGDVNMGVQVRSLITLTPFFMPYVRGGFFFDDSPSFFETGLLTKFPFEL